MFSQWACNLPVPPLSERFYKSTLSPITMSFPWTILLYWLPQFVWLQSFHFSSLIQINHRFSVLLHQYQLETLNQLVTLMIYQISAKMVIFMMLLYAKTNLDRWSFHLAFWFSFNVFSMLMIVRFICSVFPFPLGWYGVVFDDLIPQTWYNFANHESWNSHPQSWWISDGNPYVHM